MTIINIAHQFIEELGNKKFTTVLADPPWQFTNKTGKIAPEHKRLSRYETLSLRDIQSLPVSEVCEDKAHLYLWIPNALIKEGIETLEKWGFVYKSNIVWQKIRKDGEPDGRGVGFYFRNTTELILFGVKGKGFRTLKAGRTQVNVIKSRKREHSRKPDEQYDIIENCSPPEYLELFGRGKKEGWTVWGNQAEEYDITWDTYKNNSKK